MREGWNWTIGLNYKSCGVVLDTWSDWIMTKQCILYCQGWIWVFISDIEVKPGSYEQASQKVKSQLNINIPRHLDAHIEKLRPITAATNKQRQCLRFTTLVKVVVLLCCLYAIYLLTWIGRDMTRIRMYQRQSINLQKMLFTMDFDAVSADRL